MYQVVVGRKLQGRGIFVTEDRNEPNIALTPTPNGKPDERPVILGRKLAAKERRTLLRTRNSLRDQFNDRECHISPTGKGEGGIEGVCMACPVCFMHGGLRSGKSGNYGRPGIALYDDAFSLGDSEIETLTLNAVSTKTQRTGTALASETFVYGGSFVSVITVDHDAPELLHLILDGVLSTHSYGARSRHYGRITNEVLTILQGPRPAVTGYGLVGRATSLDEAQAAALEAGKGRGMNEVKVPELDSPQAIMLAAHKHPEIQAWYKEVQGYLETSKNPSSKKG